MINSNYFCLIRTGHIMLKFLATTESEFNLIIIIFVPEIKVKLPNMTDWHDL